MVSVHSRIHYCDAADAHSKQDRPREGHHPYRSRRCEQRAVGYVRSCSSETSLEACGRHDTGETRCPSYMNTH